MSPIPTAKIIRNHRSGVTSLEIVVCAGILIATFSMIASLGFKCRMIWRDISEHRLAVTELSEKLEELTLLPRNQVADRLESLQVAEICQNRLKDVQITGQLSEDNLGTRLRLQINWDRGVKSKPVQLVGWLERSEGGE